MSTRRLAAVNAALIGTALCAVPTFAQDVVRRAHARGVPTYDAPVAIGREASTGIETAELWPAPDPSLPAGRIIGVVGAPYSQAEEGWRFYLPLGRRITGWHRFAATDAGKCMEGDVSISKGDTWVMLSSPHIRAPWEPFDGYRWEDRGQGYPTGDGGPFYVWLTCRNLCGTETRCHFGVRLELRP